ncbi:hypothetical protein [Arthrobacter sp. CJ23]|uniref:hypothetical protein n=1 Tax=Arthrobacter sp. CJ23 TaxID=2972479 RepID=UPI00215CDD08|nr:hypothetical protein [Arthrobacter sp. CJ23]UVJ38148.1 hypothetical protein NVV90_12870 [Arthrobacter sp. CJ23]
MRRSQSTADAAKTPAMGHVVAALAAAAVLIFAPGIAQAAFTRTATGSTSVGSMTLPAPTGASVAATCIARSLSIIVVSYGTVPRATSYEFTATNPGGSTFSAPDGIYVKSPAAKGTWTYQIRGLYTASPGNVWTGQPFTGTVVC